MHFQLGISIGSAPLMALRGEPPTPNAPDIASVTIIGDGEIGSPLSYAISYTTPPYPSPTVERVWMRGGQPILGATGASYVPTSDDDLDVITLSVTASNGVGSPASATSGNSISVSYPAPTASGATITPSSGDAGDVFIGHVTDLVGDDISLQHTWKLDGAIVPGEVSSIIMPMLAGYAPGATAQLVYRVRAFNSGGEVIIESAQAAIVRAVAAPVLSGWAFSPASGLEEGDTVSVTGSVSGFPAPTLGFVYLLDDVEIPGPDAATFPLIPAGQLKCRITATNDEGEDVVTIGPVSVASVAPGAPTLGAISDPGWTEDTGVQTLDLGPLITGDNVTVYAAFARAGTIPAIAWSEHVAASQNLSGWFAGDGQFWVTGPAATFANATDPSEGVTDANKPANLLIDAVTGVLSLDEGEDGNCAATSFRVWKGQPVANGTMVWKDVSIEIAADAATPVESITVVGGQAKWSGAEAAITVVGGQAKWNLV